MHLLLGRSAQPLSFLQPLLAATVSASAVATRGMIHLVVVLVVVLSVATASRGAGWLDRPMDLPSPLVAGHEPQPEVLTAPIVPHAPPAEWPVAVSSPPQAPESRGEERPRPTPMPRSDDRSEQVADTPKVPFSYTVASGDTVSGLAERFGITSETIMLTNDLWDPDSLQVGDDLLILPVSGLMHTVTEGDSLSYVALVYGVSPEAIAGFNDMADPTLLQVGQKLVVPGGKIQMARGGSARGGRSVGPTGSFQWPAAGGISQYFGENGHSGIDIAAQHGSPVYAADGGVVVTALKVDYGYGWHLVIDHGNGYRTLYSHLSDFHVDYGEQVGKGERIGSIGSTGLSTGPHLHFEVMIHGAYLNPLKLLP